MILLEEEMRRVVETLRYEAKVWGEREVSTSMTRHTGEGMRAYARRQMEIRERLLVRFTELFSPTAGALIGKRKKRSKGD